MRNVKRNIFPFVWQRRVSLSVSSPDFHQNGEQISFCTKRKQYLRVVNCALIFFYLLCSCHFVSDLSKYLTALMLVVQFDQSSFECLQWTRCLDLHISAFKTKAFVKYGRLISDLSCHVDSLEQLWWRIPTMGRTGVGSSSIFCHSFRNELLGFD